MADEIEEFNLLDSLINSLDVIDKEDKILQPLLPQINAIVDTAIKSFVRSVLLKAPTSFWSAPWSMEDDAPDGESEEFGIITHAIKTFRIIGILSESWFVDEQSRDLLYAATLLKDVLKVTIDDDGSYVYDEMFMYAMDEFVITIMEDIPLDDNELGSSPHLVNGAIVADILKIVRFHRGFFSPIPETIPPRDSLAMLLHIADRLAFELYK